MKPQVRFGADTKGSNSKGSAKPQDDYDDDFESPAQKKGVAASKIPTESAA